MIALALTLSALARAGLPPGEVSADTPVYDLGGRVDTVNERWIYRFAWSGFPVGSATIAAGEVRDGDRRRLVVRVTGRTNKFIDLLWKYRLNARGSIRLDPFAPAEFVSEEVEKGKHKLTQIEFTEDRHVHSLRRKGDRVKEYEFDAPNTFDIISTVFMALNLDYEPGAVFRFDTLSGTARYLVTLEVKGRENVRIHGKEYDAYKLRVVTRDLTDPEDSGKHKETYLWVSAERPRRLLKAKSKTFVGSIYVELIDIEDVEPVQPTPDETPHRPDDTTTELTAPSTS